MSQRNLRKGISLHRDIFPVFINIIKLCWFLNIHSAKNIYFRLDLDMLDMLLKNLKINFLLYLITN